LVPTVCPRSRFRRPPRPRFLGPCAAYTPALSLLQPRRLEAVTV